MPNGRLQTLRRRTGTPSPLHSTTSELTHGAICSRNHMHHVRHRACVLFARRSWGLESSIVRMNLRLLKTVDIALCVHFSPGSAMVFAARAQRLSPLGQQVQGPETANQPSFLFANTLLSEGLHSESLCWSQSAATCRNSKSLGVSVPQPLLTTTFCELLFSS